MKGRHGNLTSSRLARNGAVGAHRLRLEWSHSLRGAFGQDKLLAKLEVGPTSCYRKDRAKRQSKETKTKAEKNGNKPTKRQNNKIVIKIKKKGKK